MKSKILSMLRDVQYYKMDKEKLYEKYVEQRLDQALLSYIDEMKNCAQFFENKIDMYQNGDIVTLNQYNKRNI